MLAVRVGLVALALTVCAWFALGARQAHYQNRATALIDRAGTPAPAQTAEILKLLDDAGTLNPDRNVDLLRAQAYTRGGDQAAAERIGESVVRAEPQNIDGWVVLRVAARVRDPNVSRLAQARIDELAPPVSAAP